LSRAFFYLFANSTTFRRAAILCNGVLQQADKHLQIAGVHVRNSPVGHACLRPVKKFIALTCVNAHRTPALI